MYILVIGSEIVKWDENAMPEGEGVPFEVDDGGFLSTVGKDEVPHWDGYKFWKEQKPLDPEIIASLVKVANMVLTDKQAAEVSNIFDEWDTDTDYRDGERVQYNTNLYRCVQDHTSKANQDPIESIGLWKEIAKPE